MSSSTILWHLVNTAIWTDGGVNGVRVNTNSPSLKARLLVCIALENLEGNALLPETLGEAEATEACSDNEYVHLVESIELEKGI